LVPTVYTSKQYNGATLNPYEKNCALPSNCLVA
jgi:hypothetical protein